MMIVDQMLECLAENASMLISFGSLIVSIAVGIGNYVHNRRASTRFQADKVSAWFDSQIGCVVLSNSSNNPVYEVVVSAVDVRGNGPRDGRDIDEDNHHQVVFPLLPPGVKTTSLFPGYGDGSLVAAEISFIDCAGKTWVRTGTGILKQVKSSPSDYYSLPDQFRYWEFDYR